MPVPAHLRELAISRPRHPRVPEGVWLAELERRYRRRIAWGQAKAIEGLRVSWWRRFLTMVRRFTCVR